MIIHLQNGVRGNAFAETIAEFDEAATFRGKNDEGGAIIEIETTLTANQIRGLKGVRAVLEFTGDPISVEEFSDPGLPF